MYILTREKYILCTYRHCQEGYNASDFPLEEGDGGFQNSNEKGVFLILGSGMNLFILGFLVHDQNA